MSNGTAGVDSQEIFDPWSALDEMRNAYLESAANTMVGFVNTDAYAQWTGLMLDSCLGVIAPMRHAIDKTMPQLLALCGLPSRDEVAIIAGRMTNIEMRLDDMEVKLEAIARALRIAG